METLSTTAWVLHHLGLMTDAAQKRFNPMNGFALATMAGTWLVGRTMLFGREVSRDPREKHLRWYGRGRRYWRHVHGQPARARIRRRSTMLSP